MKITLEKGGGQRTVEFDPDGSILLDGRPRRADCASIAANLFSILLDGHSFEAHVREDAGKVVVAIGGREYAFRIEDPRAWRQRGASLEEEGRQQVIASMPGKIVRVLAAAGQAVTAGQGLVVVEAMKMQNELRSPKSGKLERLLVSEGQAVNAGDVLAVVS